jgi:hypothetical protein
LPGLGQDKDQEVLDRYNRAYSAISQYAEESVVAPGPTMVRPFQQANAPQPADASAVRPRGELVNLRNQDVENNTQFKPGPTKEEIKQRILEGDGSHLRFFVKEQTKKAADRINELQSQVQGIGIVAMPSSGTGGGGSALSHRVLTPAEQAEKDRLNSEIRAEQQKLSDFNSATDILAKQQAYTTLKKKQAAPFRTPRLL